MIKNIITGAIQEMSICRAAMHHIRNWVEKKTKRMYISPDLKNKKWTPGKDEMYLVDHLINSIDGTRKYSNVAFGEGFQIYSLKQIKKGDELLLNYNRQIE